ncbi:hypothetical protein Bca4012_064000 [Brassica carinata]|uniref:Uncharacterized protein n=1 Tax=Brassica carinata TaxID=52824 RepID=A0A8X7V748_BRACI|nr:hypothetical protein Bca52824_033495 [Brassica carinata]
MNNDFSGPMPQFHTSIFFADAYRSLVRKDAGFDDPSEPVSHSETRNPPEVLENREDPSKDVVDGSSLLHSK